MTQNSETPENGNNSQNGLQKTNQAIKSIKDSIAREFNKAIETPVSAKDFIDQHLSSKAKATEFVESEWKRVQKRENKSSDGISEEHLEKIAQKLRIEFIAKAKSFEKNRNDIKNAIARTYQLNDAQDTGIHSAISSIRSENLDSYFSASKQRELLKEVCRKLKQNVPVMLGAHEKLAKIF
jgi:chemotaxis methyl-accepting protein methylase